jgi:SAM-dependent methyltransferase
MNFNKFRLSWINAREEYDFLARSNLLCEYFNKNKQNSIRIIDLGCGTGSFLRWCYYTKINFDEMLLVDHDKKLLNQFLIITKKFLNKYDYKISKQTSTSFDIMKKNIIKKNNVKLKKQDILMTLSIINEYNLISLSAIADILPKIFITNLFSSVEPKKIIYFSICFNGKIKWNIVNEHDKYIISRFNNHQQSLKDDIYAMGAKSIKLIKNLSKRKKFNLLHKDSSWIIASKKNSDKLFQKQYLKTIYNALKKDKETNNDILSNWYKFRIKKIDLHKSNLVVGHEDILVLT